MEHDGFADKALIEQVFEDMLARLQDAVEFEPDILQELRQLCESGGLNKPPRVMATLAGRSQQAR